MNHKKKINTNNQNKQYSTDKQIEELYSNEGNLLFIYWILQKQQKWQKKLNGSKERKKSQKTFLANFNLLLHKPQFINMILNFLHATYNYKKQHSENNTNNTKETYHLQQNLLTEESQNDTLLAQKEKTKLLHTQKNDFINIPLQEIPKKNSIIHQQQNKNLRTYAPNSLTSSLNLNNFTFDSTNAKWYNSFQSTNNYTKQHEIQHLEQELFQKKQICFSEKQIFANRKSFGIILEYPNIDNYTHVYLFRHPLALTSEEITRIHKYIKYNNHELHKFHNFIDTRKAKMLRCPLPSCDHKPLNDNSIKQNLFQHCKYYHQNDLKRYIFYYKKNQTWQTFFFSPLTLQSNAHYHNAENPKNQNETNSNKTPTSEMDKSKTIPKLPPGLLENPMNNYQKPQTIFQ